MPGPARSRARRRTPSGTSSTRSPARWATCPASATTPTARSPTTCRGSVTCARRRRPRWPGRAHAGRRTRTRSRALSSRRSSHDQATADLDSLPPAGGDPAADADRTAAEDGVEQSGRLLAAAQGAVDSAADDLRASREEWGRLRGDEDELNDRTADRLDDISLGDLEDPSWWESILGSAFDLVMDLTGLDALIDLVAAIASGDWAAALWALRELLDRVLMIVAVIALFTPLGPLVLALVAIKMAASLALYATKWPHPETGQTIGLTDVAMDSADLLGAAGDVIIAGRAAAAINAATPPSGAASAATPPSNVACRERPRAGATCPRSRSVEAGTRSRRSTSRTRRPRGTRPSSPSIGRARRNDAVSRCVGTRASRVSTATSTRRPCSRRAATGSSVRGIDLERQPWRRLLDGPPGSGPSRRHSGQTGGRATDARSSASELLTLASEPLGPDDRRWRPSWRADARNGFYALESALHVFPAGQAFVGTSRLEDWNDGGRMAYAVRRHGRRPALLRRGRLRRSVRPPRRTRGHVRSGDRRGAGAGLEHRGLGRSAARRLRVPDRSAARPRVAGSQRCAAARRAPHPQGPASCSVASTTSPTCTPWMRPSAWSSRGELACSCRDLPDGAKVTYRVVD